MPDEQLSARQKIAILIDGDNAQANLLPQMLVEAGKYGLVTVRRIYGDWTTSSMNSWKDVLNYHAVQPIQQFRYTIGKNATDSAMIIDAMDLLHSDVVSGFCLVSSDSDYTRLATRIRESGVFVMGIGEKKTPKPFVNACDVFVYTSNLVAEHKPARTVTQKSPRRGKKQPPQAASASAPTPVAPSGAATPPALPTPDAENENDPMPIIRQAYEIAQQEDGWARLDHMGNALYQLDPGFDPRTYGHRQLSRLIASYKDLFEMRTQEIDGSTLFFIKLKE
ncbi:MAG TPA: NYN domain-containing protein [Anaerolineales bacterium]|nr:NYN domain-containing protein [Anaerolineales bacterium]